MRKVSFETTIAKVPLFTHEMITGTLMYPRRIKISHIAKTIMAKPYTYFMNMYVSSRREFSVDFKR